MLDLALLRYRYNFYNEAVTVLERVTMITVLVQDPFLFPHAKVLLKSRVKTTELAPCVMHL